ncbi:MAG: glycosyltransferase family 39 protein, partial [Bryobacterales bacterium]|nr:glycosyltransferase family 39 protein [Bryobacterales bacterium]
CSAALLVQGYGIARQPIQLDEFEHLHSAWLVSQGQTPYVDFFQHHTPLFYYLAARFLPARGADFDTILSMRVLMLCLWGAAIAAAGSWFRRYGRWHGWMAVGLLAASATMLTAGHTVFLDTASVPSLMLSAWLLAEGENKPRWMLAAGVFFGFAVLTNLKASMAMFAPVALLASRGWCAWRSGGRVGAWLRDGAAYIAGGLVSISLLVLLLGPEGSVGLWRFCVELNMGWRARVSGLPTLAGLLRRDLFMALLVGGLIASRLWNLPRRGFRLEGRDAPWLFFASLLAGMFILPVVWFEYFAIVMPFLTLSGALVLGDWLAHWTGEAQPAEAALGSWAAPRRRLLLTLGGLTLVAVFPFAAVLRGERLALAQSLLASAGSAWLAAWLLRAWRGHSAAWPVALCLALGLTIPLFRVATLVVNEDNSGQRKRVEFVLAQTRPDDAVFDGYTGYGVFRPHAYFYWMIHQEVQAMLDGRTKGEQLVRELDRRRPALVIDDQWLATLPAPVREYVAAHYESTPFDVIKKRRATLTGERR